MNNTKLKWGQALLCLLFSLSANYLQAQEIDEAWIKANYTKREVMIPMRDGNKLFTAIYEPIHKEKTSPILITRTPYASRPYGENMNYRLWGVWQNYAREKYIFAIQDVRGRWKSEGEFVNVRPFIANKNKPTDIDEASDTYDTVEWLLHNTHSNNGNVGIIGCSYPGFYSLMGALSMHPAIKAAVPQAPVTDWFMGDDYHHNGAFMLSDGFHFGSSVNRPRPVPTEQSTPGKPYYSTDEYSFFLKAGTLKNITQLLGDSIQYWKELMTHPNYDGWWKARDTRRSCYGIQPAVLIVGGLFDAEDCYGTWELYKAIRKQSPTTNLELTIGPWSHGAWEGRDGSYLGNIRFGSKTAAYYQDQIEFPFLQYYLNGAGTKTPTSRKVNLFFSGENQWKTFETWPPKNTKESSFYLSEKEKLQLERPTQVSSFSEYISNPSKPVPYTDKITYSRQKEYMTDDQRFAERRGDVACFKSEPLKSDFTVAGEIKVELAVAISTTDADFVVKVIDGFPDDFTYDKTSEDTSDYSSSFMNGYQMLVRGDIMRGRFRESFEHPKAFAPGKPTKVCFTMTDVAHTFKKGHRIMIQVQSSWFPLVDRNPQQFVNIHTCNESDFIPSKIRILHQKDKCSKITFKELSL